MSTLTDHAPTCPRPCGCSVARASSGPTAPAPWWRSAHRRALGDRTGRAASPRWRCATPTGSDWSTSSASSRSARCSAAATRWPADWPGSASARATRSRSCAATTAASWTPPSRSPSWARTSSTSTPRSPAPQLVDVLEREQPTVVIHDEEFTGLLAKAHVEQRLIAWTDSPTRRIATIEALIVGHDDAELDPPRRHARIVILTSGTTGTPRAHRATRPASTRPSRCSRGCRCSTGGAPTSRPRSSTRGASPTSRSRCCWARPSCCVASSTRRTRCGSSRSTGASRWSSSR